MPPPNTPALVTEEEARHLAELWLREPRDKFEELFTKFLREKQAAWDSANQSSVQNLQTGMTALYQAITGKEPESLPALEVCAPDLLQVMATQMRNDKLAVEKSAGSAERLRQIYKLVCGYEATPEEPEEILVADIRNCINNRQEAYASATRRLEALEKFEPSLKGTDEKTDLDYHLIPRWRLAHFCVEAGSTFREALDTPLMLYLVALRNNRDSLRKRVRHALGHIYPIGVANTLPEEASKMFAMRNTASAKLQLNREYFAGADLVVLWATEDDEGVKNANERALFEAMYAKRRPETTLQINFETGLYMLEQVEKDWLLWRDAREWEISCEFPTR